MLRMINGSSPNQYEQASRCSNFAVHFQDRLQIKRISGMYFIVYSYISLMDPDDDGFGDVCGESTVVGFNISLSCNQLFRHFRGNRPQPNWYSGTSL